LRDFSWAIDGMVDILRVIEIREQSGEN